MATTRLEALRRAAAQLSRTSKVWQERQCIATADRLKISGRQAELLKAVGSQAEWHVGIVAAKQDLCDRNESRQCRNGRRKSGPGDVVVLPL